MVETGQTAPVAAVAPVAIDTVPRTSSIEPAAAPVVAPANAPTANDATNEALIAGVLGVLGLAAVGGIAFAATRRRRRGDDIDETTHETVEQTFIEEPAVHAPVAARSAETVLLSPVVPASNVATATTAPAMASIVTPASATVGPNGDPITLPAEAPETFAERDALLKELVAAEPDRANPFTGVRARARRAKLIMQSLGQDFRDRKPRIDLSEYTNRWPALRGWQPATA